MKAQALQRQQLREREVQEVNEAMHTLRNSSKADFNKMNVKISEVSSKMKENYYILNKKIYE